MGARKLSTSPSRVFEGGRHLDAVSLNPGLDGYEKAVLHALASAQDFTGDFQQPRWHNLASLVKVTGFARSTVQRAIRRLIERGYLLRSTSLYEVAKGRRLPSEYTLTSKVFDEHQAYLDAKPERPKRPRVAKTEHGPTDQGAGPTDPSAPSTPPSTTHYVRSSKVRKKWTPRPPASQPVGPSWDQPSLHDYWARRTAETREHVSWGEDQAQTGHQDGGLASPVAEGGGVRGEARSVGKSIEEALRGLGNVVDLKSTHRGAHPRNLPR